MTTDFEKLNKEEIEGKIKTLESDLAYGDNLDENTRVYKRLLEKSDPEKHKLNIKRAQQKLEDIENIKKLRTRLEKIAGGEKYEIKGPGEKKPEGKKEIVERTKTETYGANVVITDTFNKLLSKEKSVKEISNFEVKGEGKEIRVSATLKTETSIYIDTIKVAVKIDGKLVSENGKISLIDYSFKADKPKYQDRVDKKFEPSIGKINEAIKEHLESLEQEKGWQVTNIEIENGQLVVNYKKEEKVLEEPEGTTPEPAVPEEKVEGTSDFISSRDDESLDRLYAHYREIVENKDKKSTPDEIKNARIQIGFIETEQKRRKETEQPSEDKLREMGKQVYEETLNNIVNDTLARAKERMGEPKKTETTGETKEEFDLKTDQEKLYEINKNISNVFGENDSETTEEAEAEPLPEFTWRKEPLTKKKDGIDAEEEVGTINFEIGGEPAEISIEEDCWEWGKEPNKAQRFFGVKQKPIKLEKPVWDVYFEIPSDKLWRYSNKIQEFEKKYPTYPDKESFKSKGEALAYANEIKVAMAKLKREIEKDIKKREQEEEKERAQQEKEQNEKTWQEIKEGNYEHVGRMTEMPVEIADILAEKYEDKNSIINSLHLHIRTMTPEVAHSLGKYKGHISFNFPTPPPLESIEIIGKSNRPGVSWSGENILTTETAEIFSKWEKELAFHNIKNVPVNILKKLVENHTAGLTIYDLEDSEEAIATLAPYEGRIYVSNDDLRKKIQEAQKKYQAENKERIENEKTPQESEATENSAETTSEGNLEIQELNGEKYIPLSVEDLANLKVGDKVLEIDMDRGMTFEKTVEEFKEISGSDYISFGNTDHGVIIMTEKGKVNPKIVKLVEEKETTPVNPPEKDISA